MEDYGGGVDAYENEDNGDICKKMWVWKIYIDQDMRDFDKRVGGTKGGSDPFFNND